MSLIVDDDDHDDDNGYHDGDDVIDIVLFIINPHTWIISIRSVVSRSACQVIVGA